MRAILLLMIPVVLFGAAAAPSTGPTTAPSRSVCDGIYSDAQMHRGEKAYGTLCARCHGDNLLGNDDAPALVDTDFLEHWYGKPLGKLVDVTWKKMPTDGPGRISRRQSTDITAYLLSQNGYPSGKSDLVPDAAVLNGILIKAKQ
jgi:mono/diheme cytochrome c family protein